MYAETSVRQVGEIIEYSKISFHDVNAYDRFRFYTVTLLRSAKLILVWRDTWTQYFNTSHSLNKYPSASILLRMQC